jgi:hypothetical protein
MSHKFNINNLKNNLIQARIDHRSNNPFDFHTTQQLINYIYSTVELAKFKYKVLEFESDLNLLTTQKYHLCANFSGASSLLIFTKIRDRFYSFIIDKKTLSYNQSQVDLENIKITSVNIRLDNSIYNGTIMDGIHTQNKTTRERVFIMTDVYYFRGQNLINDNILHKIGNVTTYLDANLKHDPQINNFALTVNKFYDSIDLLKLRNDMEKYKWYEFKGYAFYPEKSGTKLLYLDTKTNSVKHDDHTVNTSNTNKKKTFRYICKTDKPVYATLEIRKTEQPDVYYVFCSEKGIIDGKNVIKIKKLGIALIPDYVSSNLCRNILQSKISGKALMKCLFNSDKNKWMPIEEDKIKKSPTSLIEIEQHLDIVVDYDDLDHDSDDQN